jgi:putative flippase GtrA
LALVGDVLSLQNDRFMSELLHKLFTGKASGLALQLFRYFFVGGAAFLVDYGSLWLLTDVCGLHYLLSAAIAFILGLICNYVLSTAWVFDNNKLKNRWMEFAVFALIGIIGLGLNELIMYVGTDVLHMHYMLSKLVSTALVFFWNFFARKFVLFN